MQNYPVTLPTPERAAVEVEQFLAKLHEVKDQFAWKLTDFNGAKLIRTEGGIDSLRPTVGFCPICALAYAAGKRSPNGAPVLVGYYAWFGWLAESMGVSEATAIAIARAADGNGEDYYQTHEPHYPITLPEINRAMRGALGL